MRRLSFSFSFGALLAVIATAFIAAVQLVIPGQRPVLRDNHGRQRRPMFRSPRFIRTNRHEAQRPTLAAPRGI